MPRILALRYTVIKLSKTRNLKNRAKKKKKNLLRTRGPSPPPIHTRDYQQILQQRFSRPMETCMIYTGIPRFVVLHKYCIFYQLKICGNLLNKSIDAISPVFVHFVSRFGNSSNISNFSIIICQSDLGSLMLLF